MNNIFKFLKFDKNNLIALLISLLLFASFALIYSQTRLLEGLESSAVNFRFFLRDPSEKSRKLQEGVRMMKKNARAREDIVILGIDENTVREFDGQGIQWPFPWDVHARFTRYVGTGNPTAIFFDIMFLDHKAKEKELAEAVKDAKVVFLDFPFETEAVDQKYPDAAERLAVLDHVKFPIGADDKTPPWVEEAVPPTPMLANNAMGIGYANVRPDNDHVNRRMPLVVKYNGFYYPGIDLVLAMRYYGITVKDVEIKMGSYIRFKNLPPSKMKKPNIARTIDIPIDSEGFMDINFIGGPGSFQHFPYFYFARDGKIENNSLKDKILLVAAFNATGIATDVHKSPYGDMFGIEHHANALNTILNQDFIIKVSDVANLVILFLIALIMGFMLPRMSIVVSVIFSTASMLAYFIGAYLVFDSANVIIAFSTPLILMAVIFSAIIAFRVVTEQREKKYIRQTFSKFVSKAVVDDLLKHPEKLKLGGDKKILTVFFSDIRGFTTISEKLTPEELVQHLNVYLQSMTDIVMKYNGTLDKYVGDEIMAFWGAPIPQEDHALLACKASLDMIEALNKQNEEWEKVGKPKLNIGIGLNTGDMVVGNMGSTSRMDYTLMGDNVNLGARLEGTNKIYSTTIIISEFTYEHVKDKIISRELDLIRVKGKQLPVKIYELIDVIDR